MSSQRGIGSTTGEAPAARIRGREAQKPPGLLPPGVRAPDFTLKTIGLKEISLRDYRGRNVILLFYPLDWTPG